MYGVGNEEGPVLGSYMLSSRSLSGRCDKTKAIQNIAIAGMYLQVPYVNLWHNDPRVCRKFGRDRAHQMLTT